MRVPEWYFRYTLTCNELHAAASGRQWLLGEDVYARRWDKRRRRAGAAADRLSAYLSHGCYRDAFLLYLPAAHEDRRETRAARGDKVVFKTMRHLYAGSEHAMADDAVIAERRWGSDPADRYTFAAYKEYMCKDALVLELLLATPLAIDLCALRHVVRG